MEDIEPRPGGRQANVRTAQACQRCRTLKTRCLPSDRPGTCQRCSHSKRECVWAEAPRRVKRVRGPSRISQVEQKIDGLVASLVNTDGARSTPAAAANDPPSTPAAASGVAALSFLRPLAPGTWLPVPSSFEQQPPRIDEDVEPTQNYMEKLRKIHSFGDDGPALNRPPGTLFHPAGRNERRIDNERVKELLSTGEADVLLAEYRSMSETFPFVPIPLSVSSEELSQAKPMLFLGILTAASWKDHSRQMALDEIYRQELANRTIIRPRRTLSLVQSLLVYLSWYHFVFSHKTQQIYSLLQLTIGLALDLGLHQKSRRTLEIPGRSQPNAPSPEEQRERQRTLLGCYFLSSAISIGFMKPNLLKYNDYMAECGRCLGQDLEYPSDAIIGPLTSLRRIGDQIQDTFYSEESLMLPITDSRINMNLRFIESQLDEWRRDFVVQPVNRALDLSYSFTDMQLHSIALRPTPRDLQMHSSNTIQLNALLATLEAGKRFFDLLLAFPVSEYHLISFSDWMRLPHAVITMSRLCIPNESHTTAQWDAKAAQDRVRLDLYLESLCYRMQGLSTFDKVKQPHHDFWWAMRMIMDLTRGWYCRKIRAGTAPSSDATPHDFPTPDTMPNSSNGDSVNPFLTPSAQTAAALQSLSAGDLGTSSEAYDTLGGSHDPFAFMRDMDFNMDQFLDMGIWGSESYEDMGFGGTTM